MSSHAETIGKSNIEVFGGDRREAACDGHDVGKSRTWGGWFPYNPATSWTGTEWSVNTFAKIDFFRGTADDYFTNGVCAKMRCVMRDSCDPKRHLASSLCPQSEHTQGSYIERLLGASYTAKRGGRNLEEKGAGRLSVAPPQAMAFLIEVWDEFEKLGFGPPLSCER